MRFSLTRHLPGPAGWLLLLLVLPALCAPLLAWEAPILCRVEGRLYAPALNALVGRPATGPFARADRDAHAVLAADPESWALWPLLDRGPNDTGEVLYAPPSRRHPLGTDGAGRDLLARLIHGARSSLQVALLSGLVALLIALPLGALAGMAGRWPDQLICRTAEVFAAFPALFLVLAVMSWRGPDLVTLGLLLGITRWVGLFRYIRAEYLRLGERDFVLAARALGVGPWRIAVREILPNAWGPILVAMAFLLSGSVLLEAGLSWIGLGVPTTTPSWGHMLGEAHHDLYNTPHLLFPPALALVVMVLAWNLTGESLRRRLDTRGR